MTDHENGLRAGGESTRNGTDPEQLRAALITNDERLGEVVLEAIRGGGLPVSLGLGIAPPPRLLESEHLERLRAYDPQIVVLDMVEDAERSIRAAGAIASVVPNAALVGVGPEVDAAQLLEAMRAGIVEYVPGAIAPAHVHDALERVIRKRGWGASLEGRRNGKCLVFFSPKGGAGSTTVVTNIGVELHRLTGKKTILVDLDLELGEIASMLGVRPRFHFVDLVRNIHRMDVDLLASYIESHKSGVQVLSAPFEPEIGEQVGAEEIARILGFLRRHYDYVLVDTSKSLAAPALAALNVADIIFLVTNLDVPSLRNLKRCLPVLNAATAGDAKRLRLVVNRFNAKSLVTVADMEEALGVEVYRTLVNDYDTVITSISTAQPVVLQGNSRYGKELKALAKDIVDGGQGATRKDSLASRVLSRIRARSPMTGTTSAYATAEASAHG
jgi:pilus assembly protein CpaE